MSLRTDDNSGALYLAKVFADIVCSNHNKNIILLIEGKPGEGKSWAALSLACLCSVFIAEKEKGNPWDYFCLDNVGIIMPDDMLRVIKNMKKKNIVVFDDMGMAYSGRDWHSSGNKAMNAMIQTIRTDNNIIIITVPDAEWIDKIGRNILHFKIVMQEPLHDIGYSLGKLSAVEKMYNTQSRKNIYPYLKSLVDTGEIGLTDVKITQKIRYNRIAFTRPPESVSSEYELKRAKQLERLKVASVQDYEKYIGKDAMEKPAKVTVKERVFELKRDVEAGIYPTLKQACKEAGINYNYARNAVSLNG